MASTDTIQKTQNPFEAFKTGQTLNHGCPSPGILVLTPSFKFLHINKTASELINGMPAAEKVSVEGRTLQRNGQLPKSLQRICANVFESLRYWSHAQHRETLEVPIHIKTNTTHMRVRVFGLTDPGGPEHFRVVLLFEE